MIEAILSYCLLLFLLHLSDHYHFILIFIHQYIHFISSTHALPTSTHAFISFPSILSVQYVIIYPSFQSDIYTFPSVHPYFLFISINYPMLSSLVYVCPHFLTNCLSNSSSLACITYPFFLFSNPFSWYMAVQFFSSIYLSAYLPITKIASNLFEKLIFYYPVFRKIYISYIIINMIDL